MINEKISIVSTWDMGYLGKTSTQLTLYKQYTHISLISHYNKLNKDIQILFLFHNILTINDVSRILKLNHNIVSKIVHRQDRNTGLYDNGLIELISEKPNKYKITEAGLKILLNINNQIKEKENQQEKLNSHEKTLRKELEDLKDYVKNKLKKELTECMNKGRKWVCLDFTNISKHNPILADMVLDDTDETLKKIEVSIESVYDKKIEVCIKNLPKTQNLKVSEIRIEHKDKLFSIDGCIKQTSQVKPLTTVIYFECPSCGNSFPVLQTEHKIVEPSRCGCGRKGKFMIKKKIMVDLQVLKLEELPEQLQGRTNTQQITILLKGTLAQYSLQQYYNPGSRIRINGIIREMPIIKNNAKDVRGDLIVEANYIEPQVKSLKYNLTNEEKEEIQEIANREDTVAVLTQSFFPDLVNIDIQKQSLLLALVKGGNCKRNEIHILFAGEPGLAKSDLLQRLSDLFPFCRYANGAASSSVGLTASVMKDEITGTWSLNAGTVVLANEGLCAVDEIDKMRDEEKNDLNECAEQGTVTINKAGINASLMARTTLVVACNPKSHRFDMTQNNLLSQLQLPYALITRFDLIWILRNTDNQMLKLMEKIMKNKTDEDKLIPEDTLVKYIIYARGLNPKLTKEAKELIMNKFRGLVEYRRTIDQTNPLTVRQLHAMIRLSTAFAKLRLRKSVTEKDVNDAWDIYVESVKTCQINNKSNIQQEINEQQIGTNIQKPILTQFQKFKSGLEKLKVPLLIDVFKDKYCINMANDEFDEYFSNSCKEGLCMESPNGYIMKV